MSTTARREEQRALASLALWGFVLAVCVQPVLHNIHHQDDHTHGVGEQAHSHAVSKPVNPWVQHQETAPKKHTPVERDEDSNSDPNHGDGSLLHSAVALLQAAEVAAVLPPMVAAFENVELPTSRVGDARPLGVEAWPQGPPV